jgi:prophage antirepressor-like protein
MSTPLKDYLNARDALKDGKLFIAAQRLADALGAEKPTEYMQQNMNQLLDGNMPATVLLTHNLKKQAKGES